MKDRMNRAWMATRRVAVTVGLVAASILLFSTTNASATTISATVGQYAGCSSLSSLVDCLIWPVTATPRGHMTIGNPDVSNWFVGYYWNGTNWIEGQAQIVPVYHGSQADVLTNVVSGTPEQVQATAYIAGVDPGTFYIAY